MEIYPGVKLGEALFKVGEAAPFAEAGLSGLLGLVTFVAIADGALYILASGGRGARVRRNFNIPDQPEYSTAPVDTSRGGYGRRDRVRDNRYTHETLLNDE